jgi:hypothetical protein
VPSGFTLLSNSGTANNRNELNAFAKPRETAGSTTWTLLASSNSPTTQQVLWEVYELSNCGITNPEKYADLPAPDVSDALVSSLTTLPAPISATAATECYDALAFSFYVAQSANTTVPVISGYSDQFWEQDQQSTSNGTWAMSLAVATRQLQEVGRFSANAAVSPSAYLSGATFVLYADDGHWVPDYHLICGFEFGTATGLAVGSVATPAAGSAPFDTVTGAVTISSAFARSGSYSMKLTGAAAAANATNSTLAGHTLNPGNGNSAFAASSTIVRRRHFYFDASLPAGDLELFMEEVGGAITEGLVVRYVSASQKIGVKVGNGTEVLSDAAVAANKWIAIDYRLFTGTTAHTCDWQLDYDSLDATGPVTQTQGTATGTASQQPTLSRVGWTAARTGTVYVDDDVASPRWGCYPIGDIRIVPIGPDQAGTPTISGTTANFQTYTANGTGVAWNANTARAAIDDIPPVVGSSADGIMQVTTAASDYVSIPMETYDCAANGRAPRAVRWYAAIWAASATAATLNVTTFDGSTKMVDFGWDGSSSVAQDHGQDSAAVLWLSRMERRTDAFREVHLMTQAKVDALALRFGYSTDAAPDVGVHAVLAELAVQPAVILGIGDGEGGAFKMYRAQDPITGAAIFYRGATPAGTRGLTMSGTVNGSDWSQYVGPNTTGDHLVGAASTTEVTAEFMNPDTPQ